MFDGVTIRDADFRRATFDALKQQQYPRLIAQRRGKKVSDILGVREAESRESA